jgi:hypothetical protein
LEWLGPPVTSHVGRAAQLYDDDRDLGSKVCYGHFCHG